MNTSTLKNMTRLCAFLLLTLFIASCGDSGSNAPLSANGQAYAAATASGEEENRLTLEEIQEDLDIPFFARPWSGDLDGMIDRRVIRVLTVYGLGTYFIDNGQQKGIVFESFTDFEKELNKREERDVVRVHVVFIPVARDELIPALLQGRGDIAAAGLTITPERLARIDFTDPLTNELSEILVSGPSAPPIASIDDLAGREIYVRASSSYRESLEILNQRFGERGLEPVRIEEISEFLEDEDIVEMVASGALEWTVVDDYKARLWADVFKDLVVHEDIVFRESGQLAYAIRKNSPQLKAALNEFVATRRQGTLYGNILINRYFRDFDWTQNVLSPENFERFMGVVDVFRTFGEQYGFDFLMITAQGYQESRLDQSARSPTGAIGIMQMLPSTAADPNVGISDITNVQNNIHAGVKYLDFIRNRYFNDPGMDRYNRTLFALASYNAGPARVAKLRESAEKRGYDPNVWFDNVEIIASEEIGNETVQYVANIVKYYVVYRLSVVRALQRKEVLTPPATG